MKLYGIRHKKTKQPLGISISSNGPDADFCNDYTCRFTPYYKDDTLYLVSDEKIADQVLSKDISWYNSSTTKPCWDYNFNNKEYEVFEIEIPDWDE